MEAQVNPAWQEFSILRFSDDDKALTRHICNGSPYLLSCIFILLRYSERGGGVGGRSDGCGSSSWDPAWRARRLLRVEGGNFFCVGVNIVVNKSQPVKADGVDVGMIVGWTPPSDRVRRTRYG